MPNKILIIGAIPHPDDLRSYGGVTTLMQNFIDYCNEHQYLYQHIDTLKYKNKLTNLLYFGICFVWGIATSRVVMYNTARNGAFTLFYHTAPLCYALKRKVVFRMFGGNFLDLLNNIPTSKQDKMMHLLNKSDILFFETRLLVDAMQKKLSGKKRIKWFPNCRKPSNIQPHKNFNKKFVFISRLEKNKGVSLLINVSDSLPNDYTVHLYGPLIEEEYNNPDYFKNKKAEYHGALKTESILNTLANYDVLVLPTCWKTEGYPGIIIEAMSLGMPVIATHIGGIPEMVEDGINGILIEPHDETALRNAMLSIDTETYQRMSAESLACFNSIYNSDTVNRQVYESITSI